MRNTRNFDDELFKENNDHCYSKNRTVVSRARTLAFRNGCKSKSLDIFDRPGSLATTQSMSTPSISRRQLSRVKSLASIPENSVEQAQVHSLIEDDLVVRHRSPVSIDNGYKPVMADKNSDSIRTIDYVIPNSELNVKTQEVNRNVSDFSNSTRYYPKLYMLFKCSSIMLLFFLVLHEILSDNQRVTELFTPLFNSIHSYLYMFLH